MTSTEIKNIGAEYQARFGNVSEIFHPVIMHEPQFGELMAEALRTGIALTRKAVEAVFPDIGWDE